MSQESEEIATLKKELEKAWKMLAQGDEKQAMQSNEIHQLHNQCEELHCMIASFQDEIEHLRAHLCKTQEQKDHERSQITNELEKAWKMVEQGKEKQEDQAVIIMKLKDEISDISSLLNESKHKMDELGRENRALKDQLSSLKQQS